MSEQLRGWIDELESGGNIRFSRLLKICDRAFGPCRIKGSHHFYKMPWTGKPQVNLQSSKGGKAKRYQVKQVRQALLRLPKEN